VYVLRGFLITGVALVAFAAAVLGPGAAVAVADALFWLLEHLIRAVHAFIALLVAMVT
jgi:hypothetical protein